MGGQLLLHCDKSGQSEGVGDVCDPAPYGYVAPHLQAHAPKGLNGPHIPSSGAKETHRQGVSNTLQVAVAGVYSVSLGQADHLAVVTQLKPEEESTGAGRRTIESDIIKSDQFWTEMQDVFAEHTLPARRELVAPSDGRDPRGSTRYNTHIEEVEYCNSGHGGGP